MERYCSKGFIALFITFCNEKKDVIYQIVIHFNQHHFDSKAGTNQWIMVLTWKWGTGGMQAWYILWHFKVKDIYLGSYDPHLKLFSITQDFISKLSGNFQLFKTKIWPNFYSKSYKLDICFLSPKFGNSLFAMLLFSALHIHLEMKVEYLLGWWNCEWILKLECLSM